MSSIASMWLQAALGATSLALSPAHVEEDINRLQKCLGIILVGAKMTRWTRKEAALLVTRSQQ